MKNGKCKRILWFVVSALFLGLYWVLCRFVLFGLHGMKSWCDMLMYVSAGAVVLSAVMDLRITAAAAPTGYMLGFAAGAVFNTDGMDPGGGATNNFWLIWTIGLAVCVFVGLVADIALAFARKRKKAA